MLQFTKPDATPDVHTTNLITAFIMTRDKIEAVQKVWQAQLDELLTPLRERLEVLENAITGELLQLGPDEGKRNIKTSAGTAYRVRWDRFQVEDRATWIDWVFNTGSEQMVTNHLTSEALKTHMEEHNGSLPPGIRYEHGYKTQVRRS